MLNLLAITIGKVLILMSQALNLGSGSTWPGHIALKLNPSFIKDVLRNSKTRIVIIAGTNGKTTTGKLITEILRESNKSVIENAAGANLLNGLASTLIKGSGLFSFARGPLGRLNQDYLIFECDENALPLVIENTNPDYVICLNLFRDQLDRYGEVDSIAKKWQESFEKLKNNTTLILNADDPQVAYLSEKTSAKSVFFGLPTLNKNKQTKHGADSTYCPKCSDKLDFETVFFSHLGIWHCPNCKLRRPNLDLSKINYYPLPGTYNKYNSLAASLVAISERINLEYIEKTYTNFTPAFGRQEKITYKGRNVQIFLSKNPTSFNESLQTIRDLGGKNLLVVLNDKIPDGLDVSWIWDINFEDILDKKFNIAVSGDRVYDMALRLKYASVFVHFDKDYGKVLNKMVESLDSEETLFVLANYSAMLDVRKVLTGRKIL